MIKINNNLNLNKNDIEGIIAAVEGITIKLCKSYFTALNMNFEDIKGLANITLLEALESFDTKRGSSFSTYYYNTLKNKFNMEYRKLKTEKRNKEVISIDSKVKNSKEDNLTYLDIIKDDYILENEVEKNELIKILYQLKEEYKIVKPKKANIIDGIFLNKKYTDIATAEGVNKSTITRTQDDFINFCKRKLK
jgi:RNA polymerase sigma factor (sigma-70 family)